MNKIVHKMQTFTKGLLSRKKAESILDTAYQNSFIHDLKNFTNLQGQKVLVVGCNRGLECELFHRHGAKDITGIDPCPSIGIDFHRPYIRYVNVSAEDMPFEDETFDVVATFAALEHIPDPLVSLKNMIRVTKKFGIIYCHGSLLWFSPFGHHQGEFIQNDPWIHIRKKTFEELCQHYGNIDRIVDGMTLKNRLHYISNSPEFNRFSTNQYKTILKKLMDSTSIVRVMFDMKMDYKKLMTPDLKKELAGYPDEDLFTETLCFVLKKL